MNDPMGREKVVQDIHRDEARYFRLNERKTPRKNRGYVGKKIIKRRIVHMSNCMGVTNPKKE